VTEPVQPEEFELTRQIPGGGSLVLRGEWAGDGAPVLLLHGLSATRRNVVQGSRHLVRRGYRIVSYDARGHGLSDPPEEEGAYEYAHLVADLEAVLDHLDIERAALVGSSMGAATALAFTLAHPERVPALVQITPAYHGRGTTEIDMSTWNELADVLEEGGPEAFVEKSTPDDIPEKWRDLHREASLQRLERNERPEAVAAAMRVVPKSQPMEGLDPLRELEVPTLIVGSRDEVDGLHPLEVAETYEELLPRGELIVDDEDEAPLAWQGAKLSRAIGGFLERVGYPPDGS